MSDSELLLIQAAELSRSNQADAKLLAALAAATFAADQLLVSGNIVLASMQNIVVAQIKEALS